MSCNADAAIHSFVWNEALLVQRSNRIIATSSNSVTSGGSGSLTLSSPSSTLMNAQSLAAMMDLGLTPGSSGKKVKKKATTIKASKATPKSKHQETAVAASRTPSIPRNSSGNTAAALLSMSSDRRFSAQQHDQETYTAATYSSQQPSSSTAHGFGYNPGISIRAPSQDLFQAGKFPEPSPAACGKRKVDEIAVAQMLSGVVGGFPSASVEVSATKRPSIVSGTAAMAASAAQDVLSSVAEPYSTAEMFPSEDADFLAEVLGVEDARATPPPPSPPNADDVGTPPANGQTVSSGQSRGLSLQIVNPDTLGEEETTAVSKKRLINGQASPSTPWDGQLEALVRYVTA